MKNNKVAPSWQSIYRRHICNAGSIDNFISQKLSYKKILIDNIYNYAPKQKTIVEAACGSGIVSSRLSNEYRVVGIDSSQEMVAIATEIATEIGASAKFIVGDIFGDYSDDLWIEDGIGLIFSHGVMEHFDDESIIKILKKQVKQSDYVIFSIPSNGLPESRREMGDERLLSKDQWLNIVENSGVKVVNVFTFGDIGIDEVPEFLGFVVKRD